MALSTDHPKMDLSSHSSVLNYLLCRVSICLKQVVQCTDQMISDCLKEQDAYEAEQKKAELAVQGPIELVVEKPKVASEAGAIVGLPGVLGALVAPAAKTKAAAPGDSTPVKRRRLDPCLRKN